MALQLIARVLVAVVKSDLFRCPPQSSLFQPREAGWLSSWLALEQPHVGADVGRLASLFAKSHAFGGGVGVTCVCRSASGNAAARKQGENRSEHCGQSAKALSQQGCRKNPA